jgi:hypothetical protein
MLKALKKPSWRIRRRVIFGTLAFCALEVVYLTIFGESTSLAETIANGCFLLAGSVIGTYVFGATWDDKNHQQPLEVPVDQEEPG